ncbi:MAG: CDP-archaeol synthase [Gammaproteobacteria bacterium]|jgi:CDP-2,3-bis-(O-geranylgeranyl)-sn-glycerol synthase
MNTRLAIELLLLLLIANGAPVLAGLLLRDRGMLPLDAGHVCRDGRRLLGAAKTVRGLLASLLATLLAAMMLGFAWWYGVLFSGLAMLGDNFSSFTKRRLGYPSSCARPVLDQLPESLLPLLVLQPLTGSGVTEIAVAATVFFLLDLMLSSLINPGQAPCR